MPGTMDEFDRVPTSEGSEFRTFLRRTTAFVGLATVLFLLLNARFASQITEIVELQYAELFHPRVRANVVLFGSSHSAVGIDPKPLEDEQHEVYNFSFAGASPIFYGNWYPYFAENYPQPEIVVYQVDWFAFRDSPYLFRQIEQDADLLPAQDFGQRVLETPFDKQTDLWINRFIIFQHRQKLEAVVRPFYGSHCVPLKKEYHGFCPTACPSTAPGRIVAEKLPKQREELINLTKRMQESGIVVIWVQTPEHLKSREIDPKYQEEVDSLARELNVPYLNYNTDRVSPVFEDVSLFIDWAHLNEKGAQTFSAILAQDLMQLPEWSIR
jgi:hypothetical protein